MSGAWRQQMVQATLDSGQCKEKLAEIVDETRFLHLSEREAAKVCRALDA